MEISAMIPDKQTHVAEISRRLKKLYPNAYVELDFTTPLELLVASLLAAQNRDTTINQITPEVFRKYKTPEAYVNVDPAELEVDIHRSGFFRQKTKAIRALSQVLIDEFDSKVPGTMDE